jgi:co-chaperonin GroES (HSP10)
MSNEFKGKALNYVIVLKELIVENKTAGGFNVKSDVDANEKNKRGLVVSVGNLCPKDEDGNKTVCEGQEVIYDKYKASDLTLDGVTYQCVYYSDLIMVF